MAKSFFTLRENIQEAVTVKKTEHSWGKMVTVHHGKENSYPLHPEHQAKIKNLNPGESTSFTDETNRKVTASREGDMVHLSGKGSNKKTPVAYSHFAEEASPMIKPPKNEFGTKADAFAHAKKHGGKVMKKTFTHPTSGMKHVSYVVKEEQQSVAEAGPFSYGAKPPRKGSVAYHAMMKRKEQEKNKPPIEPKDQMVGTAKLVKEEDNELKAAIKRRDENRKKMKFADAEHIYSKEFEAIMKKRGYGKHNPIPLRLSPEDMKD